MNNIKYSRFKLNKLFFRWTEVTHLFSNLSIMGTFSLLHILLSFPLCFSCYSNVNLLHNSSGLSERKVTPQPYCSLLYLKCLYQKYHISQ